MAVFQFVDTIAASPVVRLDLNDGPLRVLSDGMDLTPPPLRRAVTSTLLTHGEHIQASAWGNRTVTLPLQLVESTTDAGVVKLQALTRELVRDRNILRVQLDGQSAPVFFRTYAAPDYAWDMPRRLVEHGRATLAIPAEPFAYGLPEVLAPVIISNDAGDRFAINANPYFEDVLAPWTGVGGTAVRSTSQAFDGFASAAITPSGSAATVILQSEDVPCAPSDVMRATTMARCNVSRTVKIQIVWKDIAHSPVGTPTGASFSLLFSDWTPMGVTGTAPATASFCQIQVFMDGTPPASDVLFIDNARIRKAGNGPGGVWWNVDNVKGDVETPPVVTIKGGIYTEDRQVLIGVRRGPTDTDPVDTPPVVAEPEDLFSFGNDTTEQPGDNDMPSGFMRTTFALTPGMTNRANLFFGDVATFAIRGRYRVYARYRHSVASDVIRLQIEGNAAVTLPFDTEVRYADLGTISVPAYNDPEADASGNPVQISGVAVRLDAARDAGTGNLDIDRLVFIPAAGAPSTPSDDRLAVVTVPSFHLVGVERAVIDAFTETTYIFDAFGLANLAPMPVAGLFPLLNPGHNRMYYMANVGSLGSPDSVHDLTEIQVTYWPRYLMVRTAST